jgi:hypothetical protein
VYLYHQPANLTIDAARVGQVDLVARMPEAAGAIAGTASGARGIMVSVQARKPSAKR